MAKEATSTARNDETAREMLSLLVSGAGGVSAVPLRRHTDYVLGRAEGSSIVVPDPSVSRRHAVLRTTDLTIEDLGSSNGTRVRGVAIRPGQQVQIDVGAVIELGNATLLLQRILNVSPDHERSSSPRTNRPPADTQGTSEDEPRVVSPKMQNVYRMLDVIAPNDLGVLILGESGSGKEVFARELHRRSLRARGPFLRMNCAAFNESVLEAELFGHEKGAFTGAVSAKEGLFEAADRGTVFLDEIGEMPLAMQAKILRVLENREVLRIGGRQPTIVDVRFIAATHRDLRYLIASGSFRQDLYFRLNGFTVVVPPLRDRPEDIPALAEAFASELAARSMRPPPHLSEDAVALLQRYAWPGNVRELRTFVGRALAFCGSGAREITGKHFLDAAPELGAGAAPSPELTLDTTGQMQPVDVPSATLLVPQRLTSLSTTPAPPGGDLRSVRAASERERIIAALAKTAGNQKLAATELGISRRTLVNKLGQYGIERPRKR
jgi:transcriptional regulator with PAS, ATPase and Fis domain